MTTTADQDLRTCPQHPGGCRDDDRHRISFRVSGDERRGSAAAVAAGSAVDESAFVTEALQARLGFIRCRTCHTAVPVTFGDLSGNTLDWWISEAVREVAGQRHRDNHQPVTIGRAAPRAPRARRGQ